MPEFPRTALLSTRRDDEQREGHLCEVPACDAPVKCLRIDPRGARHWARMSRRKLVFGRLVGPDHDAVMRIGVGLQPTGLTRGEAPGGGPILLVGISAMFVLRFPPPRILDSAVRRKASASAEMVLSGLLVPVSPFSPLDVRRRPP